MLIRTRRKSAAVAFWALGAAALGTIASAAWIAAEAAQDGPERIAKPAGENVSAANTRANASDRDARSPFDDGEDGDARSPFDDGEDGDARSPFEEFRDGPKAAGTTRHRPVVRVAAAGGFGGKGPTSNANAMLYLEIAQLEAELAAREEDGPSQKVLETLNEKVAMVFSRPTALNFVLKYMKTTLAKSGKPAVPIYVDPLGLQEAECSLDSTVEADLEGVPLKTTLRLLLKQMGLAYCVRDGVLIISSPGRVRNELAEEALQALADDPEGLGQPAQQLLQRLLQGQEQVGMGMM